MPETVPAPPVSVYQLRVVLRGITPIIWRRLLVRSGTTLGRVHDVLQAAFGWDDVHLFCFKVHGRELDSIDRPHARLRDFRLRPSERFIYDYDFVDLWRHDLRVEQILEPRPGRTYPVCTGGQRAGPPEGCGGPWAFMDQAQPPVGTAPAGAWPQGVCRLRNAPASAPSGLFVRQPWPSGLACPLTSPNTWMGCAAVQQTGRLSGTFGAITSRNPRRHVSFDADP